jgi:hypothetical protein
MCDITAAYGGPRELTGKKRTYSMQGKSFLEPKNITNMKSWLSIASLKIGEISNIF